MPAKIKQGFIMGMELPSMVFVVIQKAFILLQPSLLILIAGKSTENVFDLMKLLVLLPLISRKFS